MRFEAVRREREETWLSAAATVPLSGNSNTRCWWNHTRHAVAQRPVSKLIPNAAEGGMLPVLDLVPV
jgi:hypothetical protein